MMGTNDAAEVARLAGARMLVLTHTGPSVCMPDQKEKALQEMSNIFGGSIVFGEELAKLDLW
jgi:ribonuclease BN (tRNA processing enzyme)